MAICEKRNPKIFYTLLLKKTKNRLPSQSIWSFSAIFGCFLNCDSAFVVHNGCWIFEWGYFWLFAKLSSVTLHIVKLQDFWSLGRVCLISHSGLLKKNKPNSIPNEILPTIYEIYTTGTILNNLHVLIEWNHYKSWNQNPPGLNAINAMNI